MDSKQTPPNVAQRCWRYSRILLLALGFFLFGSQDANASHFAGADLTYECVGNNRYVVTLTLYRDCDGISMSATEFLNLTSASCGITPPNVPLPRDTFFEVSQLCPQELPNSSCGNGSGIYPGIEVHIYRDTITLPQSCTDWVISWSNCCRNTAITTLTNAGSLYIEAGINSTICNNSPTFTSRPTPYFCAGQCYQYNHGAFDPENDSLRYALTCPLQGANNCIPNIAGLSPTQPLFTNPGNFGFNSNTGQMSFCTAPNQAQFAVAAVTVFQIANGDTIGYVQRDIQMIVLNNANCTSPVNSNTPIVNSGGTFDTTSNTFVVCAGESLIFNLVLSDPDGDTISLQPSNINLDQVFGPGNWSIIINTAPPFRPDSVQIFVQVQAIPANIGVNQFTIGVTDNACPIPGDQILGYNLIIPGVEVTASDTTICPGIAQTLQMNANSFSSIGTTLGGNFQWIQLGGPTITFSNDTIENPLVSVPANTQDGDTIRLQVTFSTVPDPTTGAICTTTDEVEIYLRNLPLSLNIFATDTSLCPNNEPDTISFNTAIAGPGIDLVNGVYTWTANPSSYLSDLSATNINNPDAVVSGGPGDQVTYAVNYAYGLCTGSDSVTLIWRSGIPDVRALLDTICPGDTTQLIGFLTDSITTVDPTACSTYTVDPITYAPLVPTGGTTQIPLGDDQLSTPQPIGFPFEFFCNTYTQFRISSNGFITFDLVNFSNGCCTGQTLPANFAPNDVIALAWEDLNPNNGGVIEYFTVGTAPNRRLVIAFTNVPRFGGANNVTGQIVLHEGTNLIDIHTTSVGLDGPTTQGIENVDGTLAAAVPGRNGQVWSATNDAFRFSPGISFLFGPITYNWTPGFAVSDPTISNPRAFPQQTTMFQFEVNEQGCVQRDSVEIVVRTTIPIPVITCGTPANQATSVLFEWGGSPGAGGWEYSLDSGTTWIPRPLADSSLLITGLTNGDCASILVRATGGAGPCPTNAAAYLECCTTPCPPPNTTTVTNLTCNSSADGTIDINITGGVLGSHPDFTAILFDTAGNQINTATTTNVALFTGLDAGVYYAYIEDTLGCFTYSDTVVVTQPDVLDVALDSTTLTTCFATADGSASVIPTGGTPNYTFLWDAAANSQTTATAIGLPRGTYTVTLTDDNGCTDTLDVVVNSPFPAAPSLTVNTTPSMTCAGDGSATIFTTFNLVGNANNYTYQWSNSSSTGPTATGLPAGNTSVTVTDINGCTAEATVLITGSPTVSVTAMQTISPGCSVNDGQITAVVTGDTAGYSYQWSPNASGQTTALVTNLGIGNYSVTVTGLSNGCTAVGNVSLGNSSSLDIIGFNVTNPSCGGSDGDITVLTVGATGPLNFLWSDNQTTNPATGLSTGTYGVTVTDPATGCSDVGDTSLVEPIISASFTSVNNPSCNLSNGIITVTATGAPGPFSYTWDDPAAQTTSTAVGLAPGAYNVTVTYQGCQAVVGPANLTNDSLEIAITNKDDIICNGDLTSFANVSILAGNPANISFQWSNGDTTQNIANMPAGTYTVTATSGSCVATQSITVVDVILTLNAWIDAPGTRSATIQINDVVDISGGATTNFANPVYTWTRQFPDVASIADSSLNATTATGLGSSQQNSWLYIDATAGVCTARDSVLIVVESYLGMPTAFTPNGDGINDNFYPVTLQNSDKVIQFKVFNRWGQLLYDDPINHTWDGTFQGVPQPQDVYIYIFEYAPNNQDPILIRGEFTLIR